MFDHMIKFAAVAMVASLPHSDNGHAISLVQHIATKVSSLSGNVNVGASATIDETGYQEVVEAGKLAHSQDMMSEFARRLCKSDGLRITNETDFNEFLKYFDGSCATQSFDALVMGLHDAIHKPVGCGGGWVKEDDTDADNADRAYGGEEPSAEGDGDFSLLTVRTVSGQKAQMHAKMSWIFRMVQDLRAKRNAKTDTPPVLTEVSSDVARQGDQEDRAVVQDEQENQQETFSDEFSGLTLDERGYKSIAKGKNSTLMVAYIRKLLQSEGLKATDEKKLKGIAPWYTSECGPQTFAALRNELHHSMKSNDTESQSGFCGGWVDFI